MRRAPIGLACVALMVLLPVASFAQPAAPERGGRIESLLAELNRAKSDDDDNDES